MPTLARAAMPRLPAQSPPGLLVAIFGADGSGKSTVCHAVIEELAPLFGAARYLHFRPRLGGGKPGADPVLEPHRDPNRGSLASVAKVAYYTADFVIGHALRIRPEISRGGLVVFDRYFHDLFVDPRRYRYGGPGLALRAAARLVPRPDLVILLDAPVEILLARKQELEAAELDRLRRAYVALVQALPDGHIVDAAGPLEEVTARVARLVTQRAGLGERGDQEGLS
jgi:thymidylate kinase